MENDEIKIFYPDTIEYQPFTSEAVEQINDTGSTSNKTASGTEKQGGTVINKARKFPPRPIPIPVVAKELISNNLNSQSRQILSAFTFNKTGSIQIGEYVSGVSGDIRISPNGLVARNSAGVTTVSIDGTTGDASFLGTISAGSVISASISANQITGTIVNAQIAEIDWAKITNVQIESADITSLDADVITTGTLEGIDIKIGSNNSVFKADSSGIYLGNANFSSAPFRVTMSGAVTASSIKLTNASIGSGSVYQGTPITASYIGNLTAGHITSGTITVGGTSQPSALVINESTNSTNSRLRFQRFSRIWEDNNARLGINSIGSPMFIYVSSSEKVIIPSSGQTTFRGGVFSDGNLNVGTPGNYTARIGDSLYINTSSSPSERLWVGGSAGIDGNLKSNHHDPRSSNSYNLGGDSNFWNYIYGDDFINKSLGWYDDGVTIVNNGVQTKVSDMEGLLNIKPDKQLKNKNGSPKLDRRSLPLEIYRQAVDRDTGKFYPRDKDDRPYIPEKKDSNGKVIEERQILTDSESLTHFVSVMFGALKELNAKVEIMAQEMTKLKKAK